MSSPLTVIALPIFSLVLGVIALFIDPAKKSPLKFVVIFLLLAAAVTSGISAYHDDKEKTGLEKEVDSIKADNQAIKANNQDILDLLKKMSDRLLGYQPNGTAQVQQAELQQSLTADKERSKLLASTNVKANSHITVTYFPKDVDGPVVINALKEGGFNVVSHIGNPANANRPTNAIWIGENVSVDQAKLIALTLIRAGVPISSLKRLKSAGGGRASLIEVGTDPDVLGKPPLTAADVESVQDIPARDAAGVTLQN